MKFWRKMWHEPIDPRTNPIGFTTALVITGIYVWLWWGK